LNIFGWFRRPPPIRDAAALADFIDQHAAFVAQKGIYEYARARAGPYAKVLFREQPFLHAIEEARWRAYPLGLVMVAELVEGILRPVSTDDRVRHFDAFRDLVLAIFDRYPVPQALGEQTWSELRSEFARRLQLISLHPPKLAKDIPLQFAQAYWDLMPVHENLRTKDFPTTRNYLRITMINIHDEFSQRADVEAVNQDLLARSL
jgi:hypothetical protein